MPAKKPRETAEPVGLKEVVEYFADEERCFEYALNFRWPNGEIACPRCGDTKVYLLKDRRRWKCGSDHPQRVFTVKVGTIMEDSPLPLSKWMTALWLVANCKNGISSYELARDLDITQKSAWFMNQRIRLVMGDHETVDPMTGAVEADETYIGGLARNMHKGSARRAKQKRGRSAEGKAIIAGLLQRHSKKRGHSVVRARVVPNVNQETLTGGIRENVAPGSAIYTDEHRSYWNLNPDYRHEAVHHAADEYVRGNVHTNGMENFWSLLKRSIRGTYVSVEPFHLFRYLDEQSFRFNERKHPEGDFGRFETLAKRVGNGRLTYAHLIANDEHSSRGMRPAL